MHSLSVAIITFNEEKNIRACLQSVSWADEIIVVDNGSIDNTAEEAAEKGARVFFEKTKGYGAACLKGLAHIQQTDIVVILDADYSDYPQQLRSLIEPIAKNEADFVIGSRVLGKREKGAVTPQAYWGNKLAVFLIGLFFRHKFTDMGPFRAIKFNELKNLKMADKDFGWNAEMQVKAIKMGLRIKEVPVDYRKRIGMSKISGTFSGTIKAGAKIIYTILKHFLIR